MKAIKDLQLEILKLNVHCYGLYSSGSVSKQSKPERNDLFGDGNEDYTRIRYISKQAPSFWSTELEHAYYFSEELQMELSQFENLSVVVSGLILYIHVFGVY